jgi:hypothetical protein
VHTESKLQVDTQVSQDCGEESYLRRLQIARKVHNIPAAFGRETVKKLQNPKTLTSFVPGTSRIENKSHSNVEGKRQRIRDYRTHFSLSEIQLLINP